MGEVWFPKKVRVKSTRRTWAQVEEGVGKYKAVNNQLSTRKPTIRTLKELVDKYGEDGVEVVER